MKANQKKKKVLNKSDNSEGHANADSKSNAISRKKNVDMKKEQRSAKKTYENKAKKKDKGPGFISISVQFLRDAKTELKKVKWPTKKELIAATIMVLVVVLILAFYLGVIDFLLIKILENVLG